MLIFTNKYYIILIVKYQCKEYIYGTDNHYCQNTNIRYADDKVLLNKTMSVYSDACNYVSDYVFQTHNLKQFSLNKALYTELRERFGLKSQMAQSVFKTVIARYKTVLENESRWIKPSFKKPQYDLVWNRDYSLTQNCFSVNTLNRRVKLPYFAEGMSKYFDHTIYKFGTAKLVNKHGKYFCIYL